MQGRSMLRCSILSWSSTFSRTQLDRCTREEVASSRHGTKREHWPEVRDPPVVAAGMAHRHRDVLPVPAPKPAHGRLNAAPVRRKRGRLRKVPLAQDTNTAASPSTVLGTPRLLKKADLKARTTPTEAVTPVVKPAAMRIRPGRASQPVKRRPLGMSISAARTWYARHSKRLSWGTNGRSS